MRNTTQRIQITLTPPSFTGDQEELRLGSVGVDIRIVLKQSYGEC